MSNTQCDLSNPDFSYSYCPSYAAAIVLAVLFSITTTGHVYQAIRLRKPFAVILIMGGAWEAFGYIIRAVSIQNPYSTGLYTAQMLLVLLAPLWINAFIYMLVGRMIHFFLDDDRIFGVKARKITMMFVAFDITAFLIQGTGGSMTASTDMDTTLRGLNIYTGGVALQIVFNAIFLAIVGRFHKISLLLLRKSTWEAQPMTLDTRGSSSSESSEPVARNRNNCIHLLTLVYIIITIILVRNFYRLAEFASGLNNVIIKNEWYTYVFDAVPMFACMVILNVFHPGKKLQGVNCDFTEENKARKVAKKEKKAAKVAARGGRVLESSWKVPSVFTREVESDSRV